MKSCPDCQRRIEEKENSCPCGYDFPKLQPLPEYKTSLVVPAPSAKDSQYIKDCKAIFAKAGKIHSLDLADLMFEMENKYPGKGWRTNACQVLKRVNDKLGIVTSDDLMPAPSTGVRAQSCSIHGCSKPGNQSAYINKSTHWFCSDHVK